MTSVTVILCLVVGVMAIIKMPLTLYELIFLIVHIIIRIAIYRDGLVVVIANSGG